MTTRWARLAHKCSAAIVSFCAASCPPVLADGPLPATAGLAPCLVFSAAIASAYRKNSLADSSDNRRPGKPTALPSSTQPVGGCPSRLIPDGQCRYASRVQLDGAAYFTHPRFGASGRNPDASPTAPSRSRRRGHGRVAGVFTSWVQGIIPFRRRSATVQEAALRTRRACSVTIFKSRPKRRANCAPARASFTNQGMT